MEILKVLFSILARQNGWKFFVIIQNTVRNTDIYFEDDPRKIFLQEHPRSIVNC